VWDVRRLVATGVMTPGQLDRRRRAVRAAAAAGGSSSSSSADPQPPEAPSGIVAPRAISAAAPFSSSARAPSAPSSASLGAARRAGSVATSQMDVNATEEKMRRVLGKSWVNVYRQVKQDQGGGAPDARLSGDAFRDMMAERGVPLTSKEVRALGIKYSTGDVRDGTIDAAKLLTSTFQGRTGSAAQKVAPPGLPRPGSAFVRKAPAPGATARPGSASATAMNRAVF
jgi:hypothetical protein